MDWANLLLLLSLFGAIFVNADHANGNDQDNRENRGEGRGSVEQVNRRGQSLRKSREEEEMYIKCKEKKAVCFGFREGCVKTMDCKIMVAIEKKENSQNYHFQLIGGDQGLNNYTAVGLSNTEEGKLMKDTALFACFSKDDKFGVFWSSTTSASQTTTDAKAGHPSVSVTDSKMYCEFEIKSKFVVENHEFDLDKHKYNILVAIGEYNADQRKPGYHKTEEKLRSLDSFKLNTGGGKSSSNPSAGFVNTSLLLSGLLFTCTIIRQFAI